MTTPSLLRRVPGIEKMNVICVYPAVCGLLGCLTGLVTKSALAYEPEMVSKVRKRMPKVVSFIPMHCLNPH